MRSGNESHFTAQVSVGCAEMSNGLLLNNEVATVHGVKWNNVCVLCNGTHGYVNFDDGAKGDQAVAQSKVVLLLFSPTPVVVSTSLRYVLHSDRSYNLSRA